MNICWSIWNVVYWKREIGQNLRTWKYEYDTTYHQEPVNRYYRLEAAIYDIEKFPKSYNVSIVGSDESDTITHILSCKEAKRIVKLNEL